MSNAQACSNDSAARIRSRSEDVPTGYKLTELGVIPEDWEVLRMGRIASILRGASPRPIDDPKWFDDKSSTGWLRIADVTATDKYLEFTSQKLSQAGMANSRFVNGNSLVMSICATVGKPIITRMNVCIHDGFVVFNNLQTEREYLYYFLLSLEPKWSNQGQTGSQMNLNTGIINSTPIPIPPPAEQRAIAVALSNVDKLLESLNELIAKKRAIKQAAMQQLLTGKIRLPGFSHKWETKRIGDLLNYERPDHYIVHYSEYSDYGDIPVLTANKSFILGFTSENFGVCTEIPVVVFDVFTTDSKFAAFPFKVKSSAIKLLRARKNQAHLRYIFERMQLIRFPVGDHKRYYISDYQDLELLVPDYEEQRTIAAVLSDIDSEINALEQRLNKTRAIKEGMMRQLLTGRVRMVEPMCRLSQEQVSP